MPCSRRLYNNSQKIASKRRVAAVGLRKITLLFNPATLAANVVSDKKGRRENFRAAACPFRDIKINCSWQIKLYC